MTSTDCRLKKSFGERDQRLQAMGCHRQETSPFVREHDCHDTINALDRFEKRTRSYSCQKPFQPRAIHALHYRPVCDSGLKWYRKAQFTLLPSRADPVQAVAKLGVRFEERSIRKAQ